MQTLRINNHKPTQGGRMQTGRLLLTLTIIATLTVGAWGQYSGTGTFNEITSLSNLESGAYYVFYGVNESYTGAMTNTIASGRLGNTAVTLSGSSIIDPSAAIVWKVQKVGSNYTVYNESAGKYCEITANSTSGFALNTTSSHEYIVSYDETKGFEFQSNHSNAGSRCISIYQTDWRPYLSTVRYLLRLFKFIPEPTTQATAVNFTSVGSDGFTINWTSGNGSNRIVLVKSGSAVDATPVDSTTYTADESFGSGSQIGTGNYVVYNGTGSSVAVTNLSPSTTYYVSVFEFNGSGGSENYLTTSPATGSQATNAASSPLITVSTSTLSGFTYAEGFGPSISQNYNLSGSNLDPASGNLTVTGSTNYEVSTNNSTFSSSVNVAYTSGTLTETPIYVRLKAGLSVGSYNSETVANSGGGATTKNVTCNGSVTTPEPSNHASSFNASLGTPSYGKITLTWTDASSGVVPDGYLIKASTVSYEDITDPSDGTSESDVWLKRNVAQGTQTASFGDLNSGTTYYFKIYPYKGSGSSINYKTDGSVPQASISTGALPSNLLLERNFDYTGKLTDYGWTAHSSGGTNPISTTTGLTYPGYPSSGIGNAASVSNTGEDDSKIFETQTSGTLYFSFLVKVNTAVDGYFIHLGGSSSAFAARIYVKPSATPGKINFGISNTSTASYAATPTDFDPGTIYLIIVKYDVSAAGDASFWVKSSGVPANEIDAGTPEHTTTGSGQSSIDRICLRQYSASQDYIVDGIRVATGWAEAVVEAPSNMATESIPTGSNVSQAFAGTNVGLYFGSVSTGSNVTVKKYSSGPSNVSFSGSAPTYVSNYRWVIDAGDLAFSGGVLKIAVSGLSGIGNPNTVDIYRRSTPGSGAFEELETVYADGYLSANVSSFSEFILGSSDSDNSLPVELEAFAGKLVEDGVQLSWSTASEIENQGFNLYRKLVGGEYSLLASFVNESALVGAGASSEAHNYSYTDKSIQPGVTYSYLLADVSYAGVEKKHTDKVVTVTVPASGVVLANQYKLEPVYPNPFNAAFTVPLELGATQLVTVRLYNISGKQVKELHNAPLKAGVYRLNYRVPELSSGIYVLKIGIGNDLRTQKVVLLK